jgi:glutaredoxin
MKKLLLFAIIAFGAWHWTNQKPPGFTGEAHERVIMYSLTTCGYCDQRRGELLAARIRFVEYYIDKDPARQDELTQKLQKAGIPPQRVGTPTFDVHGYMLINNPPMEKIREHMRPRKKA